MLLSVLSQGIHLLQNPAAVFVAPRAGLRQALALLLIDQETLLQLALLIPLTGLAGHGAGVSPQSVCPVSLRWGRRSSLIGGDSGEKAAWAMKECVYLITNGDLHKIGITANFERRMRELKPDHVQACLNLDGDENFTAADVERTLHSRFKHLRIPQTEYFRLSSADILECCNLMKSFSEQSDIPLDNFIADNPESQLAYEIETELKRLQKKAARLEATRELAIDAEDEEWLEEIRAQGLQLKQELDEFKEKHKDLIPLDAYDDEEEEQDDDESDDSVVDDELAALRAERERLEEELKSREELISKLQSSNKRMWGLF